MLFIESSLHYYSIELRSNPENLVHEAAVDSDDPRDRREIHS